MYHIFDKLTTFLETKMAREKGKKCDECEAIIPKERLKIFPDCKYCVKCAEKKTPQMEYNIDDLYDISELGDIVSGED